MLFVSFVCSFLARSLHLEHRAIRITVAGLLSNALLNLLVIPYWGTIGAAWATFVSQTVIAIGLSLLVIRDVAARTLLDVTGDSPGPSRLAS